MNNLKTRAEREFEESIEYKLFQKVDNFLEASMSYFLLFAVGYIVLHILAAVF